MPKQCNFTIGDTIDCKYRVVRCLGEGSFGIVYQVVNNNDETYALKLLKMWEVPYDSQERAMKRFEMEYETGRIDSPYLVHSFCRGIVDGNPYILMEFCPNGSLDKMPSNIDVNQVAHESLYGLGALHRNGKVHRDLKPENVLIKKDRTIALTDFGITGDQKKRLTITDRYGRPLQKFGTYAYMPPEQIDPDNKLATVLPTTDIFSFGVMMFYLLTGELPFGPLNTQNDLVKYTSRVKKGEWNARALCNPQAQKYYNAINGCLIPNYKQRLQSVDEVLALLPVYNNGTIEPPIITSTIAQNVAGYLLRIMQGEEYGKTYDLTCMLKTMNFLTVGRDDIFIKNDIAIKEDNSSYISRKHATIERDADGSFKIKDGQRDIHSIDGWVRSTNGTFVNSSEVSNFGYYLKSGDIISIGDVKMRFEPYELRRT